MFSSEISPLDFDEHKGGDRKRETILKAVLCDGKWPFVQ